MSTRHRLGKLKPMLASLFWLHQHEPVRIPEGHRDRQKLIVQLRKLRHGRAWPCQTLGQRMERCWGSFFFSSSFSFSSSLTKSYAVQAGFKFALYVNMTLNFWSPCPHLLIAGIIGVGHHAGVQGIHPKSLHMLGKCSPYWIPSSTSGFLLK